jgi:hypothetical protein
VHAEKNSDRQAIAKLVEENRLLTNELARSKTKISELSESLNNPEHSDSLSAEQCKSLDMEMTIVVRCTALTLNMT